MTGCPLLANIHPAGRLWLLIQLQGSILSTLRLEQDGDDTEIIRATFRSVVQHGTMLIGSICLFDAMMFYSVNDSQWWWALCVGLFCFPMYYFMDWKRPFPVFIAALAITLSITIAYCVHIALRFGVGINFHYKLIAIIPLIAVSGRLSERAKWFWIIASTLAIVALDHRIVTQSAVIAIDTPVEVFMRALNFGIPIVTIAALFMYYFKLVARQQALLKEHATTDPLTGLMNRRRLREVWTQAEHDGRRGSFPLSIVLCDVDHFKAINDNHGHEAGDEVLRKLGRLIPGEVRIGDSVCRWGGEEFLLLLPHSDQASAAATANRIRETIAATPLSIGSQTLNVTVTMGVATLVGNEKFEAAAHRADVALYDGKKAGRNRVVIAEAYYPDVVSAA